MRGPPERPEEAALEDLLAAALAAEEQGPDALAALLGSLGDRRARVERLLASLRAVPAIGDAVSAAPQRLGDFRLLSRLGGGGMGVVYLAEQESLRRPVAVKQIRAELLTVPGSRERFRREVEVVAALQHPGIVPILGVGEADGAPFFAMPLIAGRSLAEVAHTLRGRDPAMLEGADLCAAVGDGAPRPSVPSAPASAQLFAQSYWRACVATAAQVADAIAHVHGHGIVHRDLKPGNIMLTPDGRAIVLDFGLAHLRGDVRLTRTGPGVGSPLYMAPEQHRGEATDVRTDVYSLAATLAELLMLRAPFRGPDVEGVRTQVLTGQAVPLREGNRALPRALQAVVQQAMDLDPARRYADMTAFGDDLRRVLAGAPIRARGLPAYVHIGRFALRHPAAAGAAVVLIGALFAIPVIVAAATRSSQRSLASANVRAERHATASRRTVERLLDRFGGADFLNTPGSDAVSPKVLRELVDDCRALLVESPGDEALHLRLAEGLAALAGAEARTGDIEGAAASFRASIDAYEWRSGLSSAMRSAACMQRVLYARLLHVHGDDAAARPLAEQAIAGLQQLRAGQADDAQLLARLADATTMLALIVAERDDDEAESLFQRAYVLANEYAAAHPDDATFAITVAKTVMNLALRASNRKDRERAVGLYERAIELLAACDDEGVCDPQARTKLLGTAWSGLAYALPLEHASRSERCMQTALDIFEKLAQRFPATAEFRHLLAANQHNYSNLLDWWGRSGEALPWLERASENEAAVLRVEPDNVEAQRNARNHLWDRVRLLQNLHRHGDAIALTDAWLALPGAAYAVEAAQVVGINMQQVAADAPEQAAWRQRLYALLREARRRGADTSAWPQITEFAHVRETPEFRALLH